MAASSNNGQPILGINVTPLVDVVLVLLIIFMATAPLLTRRALNVSVPEVAKAGEKAVESLRIFYDDQRQIFLEDKAVTADELAQRLTELQRASPGLHISISADKAIPYGEVVQLLDTVRAAGVKKVSLEVRQKRKQG